MRVPTTIALALIVVTALGLGGLVAAQKATTFAPARSTVSASERATAQPDSATSLPSLAEGSNVEGQPTPADDGNVFEPVVTPAALVVPTRTPHPPELGQPVVGEAATVEVSHVEVNSELGGVEIALRLRNRQPADLTFPFEPSTALTLADASGLPYDLVWAEHDGEPQVPAGGEAQLVRAFFAGPVDEVSAEGLRLNVSGIPGVEDGQFALQLPRPPTEPLAAGATARGRGLVVSLDSTTVDPEQGSVDVVVTVVNTGREEVTFAFSPQHDLLLSDSEGNGYNLEWAEYDGRVVLKPGQQSRLVRGHFRGPVDRLSGNALRVEVRQLPQIGGATWTVPTE